MLEPALGYGAFVYVRHIGWKTVRRALIERGATRLPKSTGSRSRLSKQQTLQVLLHEVQIGKLSGHVAKLPACLRLAKTADRLLSSKDLGETMVVTVAGLSFIRRFWVHASIGVWPS